MDEIELLKMIVSSEPAAEDLPQAKARSRLKAAIAQASLAAGLAPASPTPMRDSRDPDFRPRYV